MRIEIGPTGRTVVGSVLDMNRSAFERLLWAYDAQLYVTWNPTKRRGMGCWEVHRRPAKKSWVHQGHFQGQDFFTLQYAHKPLETWIMDVATLDQRVMFRLWMSDIFRHVPRRPHEDDATYMQRVNAEMDYRAAQHQEKVLADADERQRYMIKQHKREIAEFRALLLSGMNPAQIANYWGRSN